MTVTVEEAQAKLPELIAQLALGEEIVIVSNSQTVARLVAGETAPRSRPGPGLGKGMLTILSDDDDHLKDFAEYMP